MFEPMHPPASPKPLPAVFPSDDDHDDLERHSCPGCS